MKKLLALLLALMMVLCCFVACDKDDDDDKKSSKKGGSGLDDYDYAEALENYMDARGGDADAYKAMAPDEYWDELGWSDDDIEYYVDEMKAFDDIEIEIEDEEKLDEDEIAEFVEEFNMHCPCDLDADDISKAYAVEATVTLGDAGMVENEWVAIKLDGEWYLATETGSFGM